MRTLIVFGAGILAASIAVPQLARADVFKLYAPPGQNVVVNTGPAAEPTVFQLTSDSSGGYGGMELKITNPLTLVQVTTLSADYRMVDGTFGGGAPRFTLFDSSLNSAYVYWGTPAGGGSFTDPNAGTWANTGNLAASTDVRVYVNGFGGQSTPNFGETWQTFVTDHGSALLSFITLDLDGGFTGTQVMDVDNFTVNREVFDATAPVPEPGTLALLGLPLAGLCVFCRRGKRAARQDLSRAG